MAIRERLVYAIDVITDGATRGLGNFKTAVAGADTTTGKFKAGASSAFASVQAHAGALALSGGAALVGFGVKAVAAFQETAIAAGKFGDATGLAVDDASRWIEVAGDVGVSAETMQGAFVKLNKSIEDGKLDQFGVELQRTADGAVDVNATMLQAIDVIGGIKDPTERAAAAQAAFGRSYAQAAEIIFDSADNVSAKLAEVSDAKVIDEDELRKAREMRETLDNLKDKVEDLALAAGEYLVPALATAVEGIDKIGAALDALGVDDLLDAIKGESEGLGTELENINRIAEQGEDKLYVWANAFGDLVEAEGKATGGLEAFGNLADEMSNPMDTLQIQTDNIRDAFGKLAQENPRAAGAVVQSLQAVMDAAEAGNDTAQQWIDRWGLSDAVIQDLISTLYDQVGATEASTSATDDNAEATEEAANVIGSYSDKLRAMREAYDPATAAARLNKEATEEKAQADKKAEEAADRHRQALDAVADAMERQQDAALQLVGGDIAVRDAQRDAAAAAEELTEILKTQEDGLRGAGAAIDAAASAQLDAASAATEYKVKQMEANGQSVDAKTKAQIYKEELQRLAGQLDGPLLAAIQRYIAELDRIPAQKNTVITTSGGGRVGTGGGETGNLNLTTQPGTVMHDGGIVGGRSFAGLAPDEVAAVLQKGEAVVTPAQQAAMGSSGPVGDITFNITMNGVNDPDTLVEGLRRHVRATGPGNIRRMLGLPPVG